MKLKEENSKQKLRGGFYTPFEIVEFILDWAFNDEHPNKILEPSCGDGIFLKGLKEIADESFNCKAIELFSDEAEKSQKRVKTSDNFTIKNEDFFELYRNGLRDENYDLIVGNPPYIRYQYLTPEQRKEKSKILENNGMKSNKSINAWVAFVVASVQLLKNNGKIGMVIPAELLQIYYAKDLRRFLVNNLDKINIITFEKLVFPEVKQEVIILLGEKGTKYKNEALVNTFEVEDISDLNKNMLKDEFKYTKVNAENTNKWTKFFLDNTQIEKLHQIRDEINLSFNLPSKKKFYFFDDLAVINVGITTGNNDYFCVSQETVDKYNLDKIDDTLLPLIGRSIHIEGLYYTDEVWKENLNKGRKGYLINFPQNMKLENYPDSYKEYIKLGEEKGVHEGYKCGIRERWYCVPSVWSPDAFLLRRNNTFPRFVLDKIGNTVSTDTMHRILFKENLSPEKLLLSYYNSITLAFTELEGRSYGGGVLEILPGELRKVPLPNVHNLEDNIVEDLLNKLNKTLKKGDNIEKVLDEIDQKILIEHLGLEKDLPKIFRDSWKTLMDRRINRN